MTMTPRKRRCNNALEWTPPQPGFRTKQQDQSQIQPFRVRKFTVYTVYTPKEPANFGGVYRILYMDPLRRSTHPCSLFPRIAQVWFS